MMSHLKKSHIAILFVLIAVAALMWLFIYFDAHKKPVLVRTCPDRWVRNMMPTTDTQTTRDYLIIGGERKETANYDMEWIKNSCGISPEEVY